MNSPQSCGKKRLLVVDRWRGLFSTSYNEREKNIFGNAVRKVLVLVTVFDKLDTVNSRQPLASVPRRIPVSVR